VTLPVLYTHVHHGTRRYAPRGGQGNASEIGKGKRAGERDGEAGPARMNEREGVRTLTQRPRGQVGGTGHYSESEREKHRL